MTSRFIIILFALAGTASTSNKSTSEPLLHSDASKNKVSETLPHNEVAKVLVVQRIATNTDLFDEMVLTADSGLENGTFNGFALRNQNRTIFQIFDVDAYDTIEAKAIKIKNEIDSDLALLQKINDTYYISLFGFQYGCCPRSLTIIKVDKDGVAKIFKDEFDVYRISVDTTGNTEYYGSSSFSEGLDDNDSLIFSTYNPTQIYNLTKGFVFDSSATKEYNEENYVFAGYTPDSNIIIASPNHIHDGKTRKPYIFRK